VVKLAFSEASRVTVPNFVPPFQNITDPDGVPPPDELTFALKVTAWPKFEGFSVDVIATAVGNFTPCVTDPLLVPQLTSPP
jgi:hypothetical protein